MKNGFRSFQGEEGVREVLQILNDEFRLSMALSGELMIASVSKSLIKHCFCPPRPSPTGCRNVAEINRNLIQFSKF